MVSINPNSLKSYNIPEVLSDSNTIDSFLHNNQDKKVVVVQGLGFVGSVMSIVVANSVKENYAVIGVDLPSENSYWKIASFNEGEFPVLSSDTLIPEYYELARRKKNIYATFDPYAYSKADIILIDINLDVEKKFNSNGYIEDFKVDLTGLTRSIEDIALNCKNSAMIVIESTVPVGTMKKIVYPLFQEIIQNRGLEFKLKLGHSYERVMPGNNYINSIINYFRVYSGINSESSKAIREFYSSIINTEKYPLTKLTNTNSSEMAKLLENSYRALNIAFIQEWTEFAEKSDVDLYEVINAIRIRDTHKNIMYPGIGVGGYCLPKDPLLASWSSKNLFNENSLTFSELAVKTNDRMPFHTLDLIKDHFDNKLSGKSGLIFGISYLENVGDTRNTPVSLIFDELIKEGCTLTMHDPYLRNWIEKSAEVIIDITEIPPAKYDFILLATPHYYYKSNPNFLNFIKSLNRTIIIDANRVLNKEYIDIIKEIHDIRIVGRGNCL